MAGAGKKTFTAGETLTASDMNNFVMDQTVMYFAGTAARASAIPTPSTGMTSYIGVTGTATIPQLETYTGSAWQTPYGLTQVGNVSFTSATSFSMSNVFTSAYQNYKLVLNVTGTSGTESFSIRMRSNTTDLTTGYNRQEIKANSTTVTAGQGANQSAFSGGSFTNVGCSFTFNIYQPFEPQWTYINGLGANAASNVTWESNAGYLTNFNSYNGLSVIVNGGASISGVARLYGLRNS